MKGKIGEVSRGQIMEELKCHTEQFRFYLLGIWQPLKDFELESNVINFVSEDKSLFCQKRPPYSGDLKGEGRQDS